MTGDVHLLLMHTFRYPQPAGSNPIASCIAAACTAGSAEAPAPVTAKRCYTSVHSLHHGQLGASRLTPNSPEPLEIQIALATSATHGSGPKHPLAQPLLATPAAAAAQLEACTVLCPFLHATNWPSRSPQPRAIPSLCPPATAPQLTACCACPLVRERPTGHVRRVPWQPRVWWRARSPPRPAAPAAPAAAPAAGSVCT